MRIIIDELIRKLESRQPVVTGVIIRTTGSAPRSEGARMLVAEDGLTGTIGGGELEGKSITEAQEMLGNGAKYRILDFKFSNAEAALSGMVCGGRQQVLLQKVEPSSSNLDLFNSLRTRFLSGERPVLLTLINGGDQPHMQIYNPDMQLPLSLLPEVSRKAAGAGISFTCEGDGVLVFGEPLIKPKIVHFAGGGHVAQAAVQLATIVGFRVRVMDDRQEFANRKLFPFAESVEVVTDFADCLGELGPDDMVVIATRGHSHDRDVLRQALKTKAGYIGMIGSNKKRDTVYNALRKEGFTNDDFARVYSPIGLKLGGKSPGEIGLSIVAQLQQVKRGLA